MKVKDPLAFGISKAVFAAILACPYTQGQVAELIGITEPSMSGKLSGRSGFNHAEVAAVARVTGTTVTTLYAHAESVARPAPPDPNRKDQAMPRKDLRVRVLVPLFRANDRSALAKAEDNARAQMAREVAADERANGRRPERGDETPKWWVSTAGSEETWAHGQALPDDARGLVCEMIVTMI